MEWMHCLRHIQWLSCCSQTCNCRFRCCKGEPSLFRWRPSFGNFRLLIFFLCVQALINEVAAYHRLVKYWGRYVPVLVSHGITTYGHVQYVATEFIKGFKLGIGNFRNKLASTACSYSLSQLKALSNVVGY